MREVTVSRFVRATPTELERALTPTRMVEYEGSFAVRDVREADGAILVRVGARGFEMELRFEPREEGLFYTQASDAGPFEAMETRVSFAPEDEGSRVTVQSSVSIGLPLPGADRLAAWKRKGELERALDAVRDDLG